MALINKPDLNRTGEAPHSKLDLLSGKHTNSLIVAILFLVTLISLIIVICAKDTIPENIVTGLIGLLGMLTGYFAGSNIKND